MTTTNGNRKILDLKRWEFCTPAPAATVAGAFVASSRHYRQQQLYVTSATVQHLYNPMEDAWVQIPSGALAGTFAVGACGTSTSVGPSGTATAGTTSTITTNLTIARDLRGYSIHITGGGANNGVTLPSACLLLGNISSITRIAHEPCIKVCGSEDNNITSSIRLNWICESNALSNFRLGFARPCK